MVSRRRNIIEAIIVGLMLSIIVAIIILHPHLPPMYVSDLHHVYNYAIKTNNHNLASATSSSLAQYYSQKGNIALAETWRVESIKQDLLTVEELGNEIRLLQVPLP